MRDETQCCTSKLISGRPWWIGTSKGISRVAESQGPGNQRHPEPYRDLAKQTEPYDVLLDQVKEPRQPQKDSNCRGNGEEYGPQNLQ